MCRLLLLPTILMVMRQLVTMITVNKSRPTLTVAIAKIVPVQGRQPRQCAACAACHLCSAVLTAEPVVAGYSNRWIHFIS